MRQSYLIQRLKAPLKLEGRLDIAFGGGLKNGGLSKEAMKLIKEIWSFDYMGSSEFEWGAVPEALEKIGVIANDLVSGSFKPHYKYHSWGFGGEPSKDFSGEIEVYYLCPKEMENEVKERIAVWAIGGGKGETTKERIQLDQYMSPYRSKYDKEVQGWLEMDNGFMFFIDETMWRKTCKLFGINVSFKKKVQKAK